MLPLWEQSIWRGNEVQAGLVADVGVVLEFADFLLQEGMLGCRQCPVEETFADVVYGLG